MAQTESFEWVKQISGDEYIAILNSIHDEHGNTLITGYFQGTFDFDPGPGLNYLVSDSSSDGFLGKYSAEGSLKWIKQFNTDDKIFIRSLDLDSEENIILGGSFSGTIDLNPGVQNVEFTQSSTDAHSFICKLDSLGNYQWAYDQKSSTNHSIAIDELNNIYSIGNFQGTVDFAPDTTEFLLYAGVYASNTFISKSDFNGQLIWAKHYLSTNTSNYGTDIVIDQSNNIITTGYMNGITDFDPTLNNQFNQNSNGEEDIYICKLDSSGILIWAKSIGGLESDKPNHILTDPFDNIYLSGYFQDSIDINPNLPIQNMNNLGDFNGFLLKLDSSGNYTWSIPYGGLQLTFPTCVTIDPLGDLYTTGIFKGSVDFDPGTSNFTLNSVNQSAFIQKITDQGEFVWAKQITSENGDAYGMSICVDDSFEVYTMGVFEGNTDFGIGSPNQFLNGGTIQDGFIHKISQNISTVGVSELNPKGQYTISPNPATSFVQLSLGEQSNRQITILDITGKLIEQFRSDQEILILDISKYTPGIYFIHIEDGYSAEVLKLVVE